MDAHDTPDTPGTPNTVAIAGADREPNKKALAMTMVVGIVAFMGITTGIALKQKADEERKQLEMRQGTRELTCLLYEKKDPLYCKQISQLMK